MRRVVFLLAILLAACGQRPSNRTPVILISVDTLRSDRLPAYGYTKISTPAIDALRADSILYERAYSHCPLTLPSHATMFTGLLPAENGLRDNIGFMLDGKVPTLAALLRKNGYATGAAVSAYVLRATSGISRGFDWYDDDVEPVGGIANLGSVQRDGADTARVAREWVDKQKGPFFLFLHLYDPHTPYRPPEPFLSRHADRYDGEIEYTDQVIGDFISYLKERDLYDDALIIFTSDHGEGLGDHGEDEHGIFLYREAIQVPLFVKLPGGRKGGSSVATPVQLVDIFPTILEQTATAHTPKNREARSLLASLDSDAPARTIYSESYYPRFHFGWSDLHSLIDGDHHYIKAPKPELYDLKNDPREKTNALEQNRRAYVRLRSAIEPYVREASAPAHVDPEEASKLAALGYIGSAVTTVPGEELPDPKDNVETHREIRLAFTKFKNKKNEEALALTNKLLEANGNIIDLWDLKAQILGELARHREAIEAAKEGLRRSPNAIGLLIAVANLSIITGDLEDAQRHAELLAKLEPGKSHEILARVWTQRGKLDKAREEADLALKTSSDPVAPLMTIGLIEKQKNNLTEALKYLDQAADQLSKKKNPRTANLHFYRGDVLARLGRSAEAEQEFRKEIELFPDQPDAYSSLILLLSSQGRIEEATQLVFALVEKAPVARSYIAISETLKAVGDDRGAVYWANQGLQRFPENGELKKVLRAVRTVS
ncbi:MAG TPA: sulfatase-like hydrolase/transferase [Thermoanaerobaculia bacterium]|nr:sulfatase-like hydrolase/transferase [Thermoanaerobaculia bacterium]